MLRYRLISGILLNCALAASIFWRAAPAFWLFFAMAVIFLALGLQEFFKLTKGFGIPGFPKLVKRLRTKWGQTPFPT